MESWWCCDWVGTFDVPPNQSQAAQKAKQVENHLSTCQEEFYSGPGLERKIQFFSVMTFSPTSGSGSIRAELQEGFPSA